MANGDQADTNTGWMSDVQRALALLLIGTVAFMVIALTIRIVISGDLPTIAALLKELKDALTNMSLIALGFFFGNTMAKMAQDVGQQKVVDKLTSNAPPPSGPVAPVPASIVVLAWWSLLTDAEKTAITAAAANDPRIQNFVTTAGTGKAAPDDLAYLVSKNLLTQDRATAIQST